MLRWFFSFLAIAAAAPPAGQPFWKSKDKVYQRIQNGEVIVSVAAAAPAPPQAKRLTIQGGGHVRAPRDFVFTYARDFDQIARLSGFIQKSKYNKDDQTIDISVSALGHTADLRLAVKTEAEAAPKAIEFEVIRGPLTGMKNRVTFAELSKPTLSEVGIAGEYRYDQFPIPQFFLEFGMEVVFQKIATRLRQQAEAAYRAEMK